MSRHISRIQRVPPQFDAPMFDVPVSQRCLLGMAWLLEQSARSCDHDGDVELGALLRKDAAAFRARAVNT